MSSMRSQGPSVRLATLMVAAVALALGATPARAHAQERMSASFHDLRRGFGLRAGVWQLSTADPANAHTNQWPLFEVFYERGMGRHTAMVNSLGFFRRDVRADPGTTLFGNTGTTRITSYIIPLLIGVDYFPLTRASSPIEPYVRADVGVSLGIDASKNSGTGPFGGTGGTSTSTGFGAGGGAGVKVSLGRRLDLALDAGYMVQYFGAVIGVGRTYQGPELQAGLMYRLLH